MGNSSEKIHRKLINFFYVFIWSLIVLNLYFIFKIIYILENNMNEKNKEHMENLLVMRWYPITQVICNIPATIHRVYNLISGQDNFVMGILQAVFDSIIGIVICVIFLLSPEIRKSYLSCFRKFFARKKIHIEEYIEDSQNSSNASNCRDDDFDNEDINEHYVPPCSD